MKISWIPSEYLPTPGQLGLCRAPGSASSSTVKDLEVLVREGVGQLICLQQAHELSRLEPPETIPKRQEAVQRRGMVFVHEPIEDFGAPTLLQAKRLVEGILGALARGEKVVVHCWAGLGRAGTLAACVLVTQNLSAQGAIEMVRWIRPGAIQTHAQEVFIERFALPLRATP